MVVWCMQEQWFKLKDTFRVIVGWVESRVGRGVGQYL